MVRQQPHLTLRILIGTTFTTGLTDTDTSTQKVPPHSPQHGQMRNPGPRPLPRPQPSARPLLLRPPSHPRPPSLGNIYKLLKKEYPDTFSPPPRNGGLLTPWADRGVLLLNTCLTVRAHEANSHANRGWERFTQKVIDVVARRRMDGVVFLAWGSPAAKRVATVNRARHCVLQSVHPSPLSAARGFVSRLFSIVLD